MAEHLVVDLDEIHPCGLAEAEHDPLEVISCTDLLEEVVILALLF